MRINHNLASLNTYRQLSSNSANGARSLEKLSSGLRINKAGDDAAGLAISEKMRGQIRGLDQASRNSQDAISLVQTAEGALSETHSILQRMRELSVQASSDTQTADDRSTIQDEVTQLKSEIDRITSTTEFNTKKLLNGSVASNISADGSLVSGAGTTSDTQAGSYSLDLTAEATRATMDDAAALTGTLGAATSIGINGTSISLASTDGLKEIIDKINLRTTDTGVTALAGDDGGVALQSTSKGSAITIQVTGNTTDLGESNLHRIGLTTSTTATIMSSAGTDATGTLDSTAFTAVGNTVTGASANSKGLKLNIADGTATAATETTVSILTAAGGVFTIAAGSIVVVINGISVATSAGSTAGDGAAKINADSTLKYYVTATASTTTATAQTLTLTSTGTGENAKIRMSAGSGSGISSVGSGLTLQQATGTSGISTTTGGNVDGNVLVDNSSTLTFQIGANAGQSLNLSINNMSSSNLGGTTSADKLDVIDVTTRAGASTAVTNIDLAIKTVSSERSKLGAITNRLEHTITNLGTTSENLTASESRIRDVDMAKEMMEFTKNNILSQAAQSMLAQANQQPQGVLQLLR